MPAHWLRKTWREFVCSPAPQAVAAGLGFGIRSSDVWVWSLPFIVLASGLAWISVYRRQRAIADLPTSTVNGAAQGYVELCGSAKPHAGSETVSPLTGLPCLWYRYVTEEQRNDKWQTVDRGTSEATFALEDRTGSCVVDPDHAEVSTSHKQVWVRDARRYTEYLLLPKDKLYVLGEFTTLNPVETQINSSEDIGELLADWKRDRTNLLARFDLDRDGEIDEKEWLLARAEAKREVRRRHQEMRAQPGVHVIRVPQDGRPFLISNAPPESLVTKYKLWGYFHVAAVFAAVIAWGVLLARK